MDFVAGDWLWPGREPAYIGAIQGRSGIAAAIAGANKRITRTAFAYATGAAGAAPVINFIITHQERYEPRCCFIGFSLCLIRLCLLFFGGFISSAGGGAICLAHRSGLAGIGACDTPCSTLAGGTGGWQKTGD